MKRTLVTALLIIVWLIVSIFIAHLWVTHPDWFPSLPARFWKWADSYYESTNAEEVSDLEFVVTFSISAFIVFLISSFISIFWRKFRAIRSTVPR